MRRTSRIAGLVVLAAALAFVPSESAARRSRPHAGRRFRPVDLVWHVETLSGELVETHGGDDPINPASVVKVATSWWALEKLGPDFRFETRFLARGRLDPERGLLQGDLLVEGSGDPDFHAENAFLVAAALNRLSVRQVTGALMVNSRFWMGWENGSAGMEHDPVKRGQLMASRLRRALDPRRWDGATRAAWRAFADRRGLDPRQPPRVVVSGGTRLDDDPFEGQLLMVHRAKPLADTLRRFNCFSNNDIERVGCSLGPASELGKLLAARTDASPDAVKLETTSGLGENRITPRLVVRMMREFRRTAERVGKSVESLLPVAGCDPGTVTRFFPQFASGANATALVGKTGTLTATDGGVSVLAGFLNTGSGELVFCVAAPRSAGRVRTARSSEERWLLDLIARNGGPEPRTCAPPLGEPDTGADVIVVHAPPQSPPVAGSAGPHRS